MLLKHIYDSESGLLAQVVDRDSINSTVSRDEDGINLNNIDDVSGGFIIDLYGLDTVNLGGNITIEMVVKTQIIIKMVYIFKVFENLLMKMVMI